MDKTYTPANFENKVYQNWMQEGYFRAEVNPAKKPFTIIMPPPNITGQLHMGHAMGATIQDAITRYKRMKGFEALWLPGTDHASIATEVRIVEQLKKEGLTKEGIGRAQFLKRAYAWNDQYGSTIVKQLYKMGSSCDWSRLAFTMDAPRTLAVKKAFQLLYDKGYIYRGNRMINWCPDCRTAISDAEVEYQSSDSYLWHIKYPIADSDECIVVATTRPETMLGDTAVAVHPDDARYRSMVGKQILLPLTGRRIPIIADAYVDQAFGSGAVKITPAHDPNDYEIGIRHGLEQIKVMNDDATMHENAGPSYQGLTREAARLRVVEDLKTQGFLIKAEKHLNNVGHCHRCNHAIEPMISQQWFVKMERLIPPAVDAVKNKSIRFLPKRFEKMYLHWMQNSKDWCISRQLWWGHRIPVFYCDDCGKQTVSMEDAPHCETCGKAMRQDESVLDTWFSSALWPFSTLGWPEQNEDLAYFYPTAVMETAYDIIGFWVSRMIFSGIEFMQENPFEEVLIHGIVRDALGRKMSKSLDNGVDPLEVIALYGADTLRISLVSGVTVGNDIKYSADKQENFRNFMNKIWNASRFVLLNLKADQLLPIDKVRLQPEDKWILGKLNAVIQSVTKMMDKYEIGLAAATLYDFVWNHFCDWYIEMAKVDLYAEDSCKQQGKQSILLYALTQILKLLHPIIPFITEEIYSMLPEKESKAIMIAPYPAYNGKMRYRTEVQHVDQIIEIIKGIRNLRAEMNVPQSKRSVIYIRTADEKQMKSYVKLIERLAGGKEIRFTEHLPAEKCASLITETAEIYLPVEELIDFDAEAARLQKELDAVEKEIQRARGKLANEGFLKKAPADLIEEENKKLKKYLDIKQKISASIADLSAK